MTSDDVKAQELTAAVREIQERVRARHPDGTLGTTGIAVPELIPVLHARDAADAKVAAIGSVNPRGGGLLNNAVQAAKKLVARALHWHVREQIEFNRAAMQCIQTLLEAFEQNNRALSQIVGYAHSEVSKVRAEMIPQFEAVRAEIASIRAELPLMLEPLRAEAVELKDVRAHWAQWRQGWEEKLNRSEVYMLRTISELNASFQHRATLTEDSFRKAMLEQHGGFQNELAKAAAEIQQQLWLDLRNIRAEYEKLIFDELRVIRQRSLVVGEVGVVSAQPQSNTTLALDWLKFSDRFRGTEDAIRRAQAMYVEEFAGAGDVLDLGCGRGEFLEAARDAGISARGIDLNPEAVALCRAKGLDAAVADIFEYLASLPDKSLGGVYCAQVIEHLAPAQLPELLAAVATKLRPGAKVAFETPNPECLAIFSTHFYLDPTHTRPVPPALLVFYLEETGFGQIDVKRLNMAAAAIPALNELPEAVREACFGSLDYAVIARKL